jgi:tRNA threonylcarbamoyladenosine biosynthesis protein TsaB
MNILAIDTSSKVCSIALSFNGKEYLLEEDSLRMHNACILPMIKNILSDAKVELKQLDAIAFGQGPGSFVGVRVAAAVTQGLAFAADLPVISISSLQVAAQTAYLQTGRDNIMVAIDARMNSVYFSAFELNNNIMQTLIDDVAIEPSDLVIPEGNFLAIGNGWNAYPEMPKVSSFNDNIFASAKALLQLAQIKYKDKKTLPAEQALPVYLKDGGWKKLKMN